MSARSTMATASTALALALAIAGSASAQDGKTKTAPTEFEKGIPKIPGKSLLALKAENASGQLPSRIPMQGLPSATPT